MGLFGGFRAKFTKDSTAKSASKSSKKDTVVCVGYRVYSEFQDPPHYSEPTVRRPLPAIKTIAPRAESSRNANQTTPAGASALAPVKTQIITNLTANKPSNKRAPATPIRSSSKATKQRLTNSETNISHKNAEESTTIEMRNGGTPKGNVRSAPNSVYVVGKTSSFNPLSNASTNDNNDPPPKSILKTKSLVEVSQSGVNDDDYIEITNNSDSEYEYEDVYNNKASKKTTKNSGYKTETVSHKKQTSQVSTYAHTEVSGNSEKTTNNTYYSGGYATSQNTRSIGTTSSHAANIFFGGDEEPEVQRPRRAQLTEDESRSSAEC